METLSLLDVRGLGRRDAEGRWLLRDVHLSLSPGERLMLTGPSGAGKTLLLRALALLDPWQEGELTYGGTRVPADGVPAYRARVTYLHQRPVLFEGTVRDNLLVPTRLHVHQRRPLNLDQATAQLLASLDQTGAFLSRSAADLSGGEGQVLAVVRATMLAGAVLLLDEPTASTDEQTSSRIEALIEHWMSEDSQRAFIWVTHDRLQWKRMGGDRLVMRRGRLEDPTNLMRDRRRTADVAEGLDENAV